MKCTRRDCTNEGEKRHTSSHYYCRVCYRIMKILDYCSRAYPNQLTTWAEIEKLWTAATIAKTCPHCSREMIFYPQDRRRSGMATIQHYDDGTLGIICFTCNLAHSKSRL